MANKKSAQDPTLDHCIVKVRRDRDIVVAAYGFSTQDAAREFKRGAEAGDADHRYSYQKLRTA